MTSRFKKKPKPEIVFELDGHTFTVSEILEKYRRIHGSDIARSTIHARIKKGCDYEQLFRKLHTGRAEVRNIRNLTEIDEHKTFFKIFNKALNV